jgi:hypothetical protein
MDMVQTAFNQRVRVYSVKRSPGDRVQVRAEGKTSIGKMSIFFEMSPFESFSMGKAPRVNEEILVDITIPADSEPSSGGVGTCVSGEDASLHDSE